MDKVLAQINYLAYMPILAYSVIHRISWRADKEDLWLEQFRFILQDPKRHPRHSGNKLVNNTDFV